MSTNPTSRSTAAAGDSSATRASILDKIFATTEREIAQASAAAAKRNAVIGALADSYIASLSDAERVRYFVWHETQARGTERKLLADHPARPDAVKPLVEAALAKREAAKEAAKSARLAAAEAKERETLEHLQAKYGDAAIGPAKPKNDT